MNTVAIVQARMGSTRLPGKVMADICGKPMLWHIVTRLKRSKMVDAVVVAIPNTHDNRVLMDFCIENDFNCIAPSIPESDLLARHVLVAEQMMADIVVRVPGDNPCVDPELVDFALSFYQDDNRSDKFVFRYQNIEPDRDRFWPDGFGCEIYDSVFLSALNRKTLSYEYREHPHKWFQVEYTRQIPCPLHITRSDIRLDVNTPDDLEYVRGIYESLYPDNPEFGASDIIRYLDAKENLVKRTV